MNNSSIPEVVYPDGTVWTADLIQRTITLSLFMFFTILGNSIIILVLSRPRIRKQSPRVNLFILNLAVGDLAVGCITMLSELLFEIFGEWIFGAEACKIVVYLQIITLSSTIFILIGMTYDRYQAICQPLSAFGGVGLAKKMIIASWVMALIVSLPQLFIFVQVQDGITTSGRKRYVCVSKGYSAEWQRKLYFVWNTVYILIIPVILISYFYYKLLKTLWEAGKNDIGRSESSSISKAKIKTLRLTLCIIISFIICWTPYFIINDIRIFSDFQIEVPKALLTLSESLVLMNSALNPFFYGFFNVRLRNYFKVWFKNSIFNCCFPKSSKNLSSSLSGSTTTNVSVISRV